MYYLYFVINPSKKDKEKFANTYYNSKLILIIKIVFSRFLK